MSTQPESPTGNHNRVFQLGETVQSWDDDYYHPIALKYYDRIVPDMLRWIGARAGSTVLDAGCGPGVHSIRAARFGCRVHAIDISATMLEAARNRIAAEGYSELVTLEQADLTALQLPDASYDHVFSWGVVIHIPPPGTYAALENLARVVRKGGRLALYLVNRSALDNKLETVARAVTGKRFERQKYDIGRGAFYDMHGERLWVWRFDHAGLTSFMEKLGLKLVRRVCGEFSEIQRRAPKAVRPTLLHFNNLAYSLKLPAPLAITNLWIFEKE